MIFDAENREDGWFSGKSFDVCIVGSGPAGITLARALAAKGRDVGLFEGGADGLTTDSQELYKGDIVGVAYRPLDMTRLRFFGGTSNHWAGWCRALDEWDFLPNPVNPHSGWPITKADLDGYAAETDQILDLAPYKSPKADVDFSPFTAINFRDSGPTRFRDKYRDELTRSQRIHMYLNANLVEIAVDEARRNVTELRFRSFNRDGSFAVKANCFILCLGGIENARLLLNAQIGNQHDLVGRNFCEHLVFTLGEALFKLQRPSLPKFLAPTPDFISRAAILNFNLRLRIPKSSQPARSYLRDMTCSPLAQSIAEKLSADFGCDVPGQLRVACEQALNPDSRVRLTDSRDRFGLRRVALDWRINDVDRKTIRTGAIEGARMLATQDVGRVRLLPWVLDQAMPLPTIDEDEVIGFHHMCTTRMSADPSQGVVDKDCRIHGTENLYLGGSSVFATSGQANPTYTIVQLALRLADHLNHRLDGA